MKIEASPPFLRPRLLLFIGADLIGSTALKQKECFPIKPPASGGGGWAEEGATWYAPITYFYKGLEQAFLSRWRQYADSTAARRKNGWASGPDPVLWKANGDELIFVKQLDEVYQASATISCWLEAIRTFRPKFRADFPQLDIKSTAWTAGFPIANAEVAFADGADTDLKTVLDLAGSARFAHFYLLDRWHSKKRPKGLIRDFIGPSIDTGFRVASRATERKMALTVELALLLAACPAMPELFENEIRLRYEGRSRLKGVLEGKPYPHFWIDVLWDDPAVCSDDDMMVWSKSGLDQKLVMRFCEQFLKEYKPYLLRPFISGCSDKNFNEMPEFYEENIAFLWQKWEDERRKLDMEMEAYGGKGPKKDGTLTIDRRSQAKVLSLLGDRDGGESH